MSVFMYTCVPVSVYVCIYEYTYIIMCFNVRLYVNTCVGVTTLKLM